MSHRLPLPAPPGTADPKQMLLVMQEWHKHLLRLEKNAYLVGQDDILHDSLSDLPGVDPHTQYHTDARGDARYIKIPSSPSAGDILEYSGSIFDAQTPDLNVSSWFPFHADGIKDAGAGWVHGNSTSRGNSDTDRRAYLQAWNTTNTRRNNVQWALPKGWDVSGRAYITLYCEMGAAGSGSDTVRFVFDISAASAGEDMRTGAATKNVHEDVDVSALANRAFFRVTKEIFSASELSANEFLYGSVGRDVTVTNDFGNSVFCFGALLHGTRLLHT